MFGAIKKLFSKSETLPSPQARPISSSKTYSPVRPIPTTPSVPPPLPRPAIRPIDAPTVPLMAPPKPAAEISRPSLRRADPTAPTNLVIPLHLILARLPSTLTAYARSDPSDTVYIPLELVMKQLPFGAVRMSFGDLRHSASPGVFSDNTTMDQVVVEIPLSEILSRLAPSFLARGSQTKTTVPDGLPIVFGTGHTEDQSVAASQPSSEPAITARPVEPEKIPFPNAQRPSNPVFERAEMLRPAPNPAAPSTIHPVPSVPSKPLEPHIKKEESLPAAEIKIPFTPLKASSGCLTVLLSEINQSWPEAVKQEIRAGNFENAALNLPLSRLEPAMRGGRVAFPWGELVQWITPTPKKSDSPQRDAILNLPLNVLAPLFLAQQQTIRLQKKVTIADNIPDVFCGLPSPIVAKTEPAPLPPLKLSPVEETTEETPTSTEAMVESSSIEKPAVENSLPEATPALRMVAEASPAVREEPPVSFATEPAKEPEPSPVPEIPPPSSTDTSVFFNPGNSSWSPREVVRKTLSLNGVAGSLISMSDGLLVANKLPELYKPETIAAFLPQIFGRMNQYSKELQLGALSCVNLTVNDTPCAIYKAGTLYFMVLGRSGETLPEAKLLRIAKELAKQNS